MTDTQTLDRSYLDQFQKHNQGSRKPRPTPGEYYVQFPNVIEVTTPTVGGKLVVEASLKGTIITRAANGDETFRGAELQNFLRANTLTKKIKGGDGLYTDLDDLLETQGVDVRTLNTVEDYTNAINTHVAGQESAIPLYLTYNGQYKKADGKKVFLKSKDFTRADGTFAKVTYLIDESTGLTATDPDVPDEVKGNEQAKRDYLKHYKVIYANLEPGFRGFATPEAGA